MAKAPKEPETPREPDPGLIPYQEPEPVLNDITRLEQEAGRAALAINVAKYEQAMAERAVEEEAVRQVAESKKQNKPVYPVATE